MSDFFLPDNFFSASGDFGPDRLGVGEPLFRALPSNYGDQSVGGSGNGLPGDQGDADQDGTDAPGQGDGQGEGGSSPFDGDFDPFGGTTAEDAARRGLSPEELTQLQRSLADDIAKSGKAAGNMIPEGAVEWAAEFLLPPVLPLHELFKTTLGRLIDSSGRGSKSTYRRRSRRQDAVGGKILLPGKARSVTEIMVGIDVSGSRSDEELARDFTEITAIAESKGYRVKYFSVSTVHHEIRSLMRGDRPIIDRDYAGTDMRMAFEVFDAHDAPARILMTDGYTDWPDMVRSGTETLVAITSDTEEEYERMQKSVTPGVDTVWLPPAGVQGRPGL